MDFSYSLAFSSTQSLIMMVLTFSVMLLEKESQIEEQNLNLDIFHFNKKPFQQCIPIITGILDGYQTELNINLLTIKSLSLDYLD